MRNEIDSVGTSQSKYRQIILCSVHEGEDANHTEGVALMLSQEAQNALISWEAARPMIVYATFKTKKETSSASSFSATNP